MSERLAQLLEDIQSVGGPRSDERHCVSRVGDSINVRPCELAPVLRELVDADREREAIVMAFREAGAAKDEQELRQRLGVISKTYVRRSRAIAAAEDALKGGA